MGVVKAGLAKDPKSATGTQVSQTPSWGPFSQGGEGGLLYSALWI